MVLFDKYKTLLTKNGVNTPLRLAHFAAQVEHESGFKPIKENLNYSADRLLVVFPKYFTKDTIGKDGKTIKGTASLYARNPEMIANKVYANRMGNGDEKSGEPFKYIGRGFIQLTGKANYQALSTATGTDYINNPDKLLTEADSMVAALWFWTKNNLNKYADSDDINTITKKINGGLNGLEHRKELLEKNLTIFREALQ